MERKYEAAGRAFNQCLEPLAGRDQIPRRSSSAEPQRRRPRLGARQHLAPPPRALDWMGRRGGRGNCSNPASKSGARTLVWSKGHLSQPARGIKVLLRVCKRNHLAAVSRHAVALRFRSRVLGVLSAREPQVRAVGDGECDLQGPDLGPRLSLNADGAVSERSRVHRAGRIFPAHSVPCARHFREAALAEIYFAFPAAISLAGIPD